MATRAAGAESTESDESGLTQLREETLGLLTLGLIGLVLGLLGLAAVDSNTRQPEMVFVIVPILFAAQIGRLRSGRLTVASTGVIGALGLSVVAADLVYPNHQLLYAFSLLTVIANILIGGTGGFAVAVITSVAILRLPVPTDVGGPRADEGTVLFLIWSAAILSWLGSRPIRTALDWSWRSYLLALDRTEELQDRQGELGRLAKSLDETCYRLEQLNGELDRARRAAEEARQLKSSFAATISHELRTPLNLIIGFSEMMMNAPQAYARQQLPPGYRLDLEAIHRNASQISRLIDDVLDLSQIDAQRLALERSKVPFSQIAADAAATVSLLFEHLGLTLTVDVPDDLPVLNVDANRIRQILINLLSNSGRFTDRGGVTVTARCTGSDIIIAVSDTGAGIAPDDLPYVFEEFHQVGLTGRRRGGSGLGLAVCKRFAEMHGGWIWAESNLGVGSTFYLSLPLGENVVVNSVVIGAPPRPYDERTIVVVDPVGDTARVLQRYLDAYQVIRVATVGDVLPLATKRPIHALVFTSPTHADAWSKLPTNDEYIRRLPTFACALRTPRALAEELGVVDYLVKPVSRDRLGAALRRVGKNPREVLIVEDDPEMARLLSTFVRTRSRRYRVTHVGDGAAALARVRDKRPDVVLLDLLIPGASGYEVLRQMRADPTLRDVAIVVVSGKGDHDEAIVASDLSLSRADGLTIGELMRCLRGSLDALLNRAPPDSVPARPANSAA